MRTKYLVDRDWLGQMGFEVESTNHGTIRMWREARREIGGPTSAGTTS
jgi:hypothetical protein